MKYNESARRGGAVRPAPWEARPRWRIAQGEKIALGPGKADLLEAIGRTGSISAAAVSLGMSYRRAWVLVATMNQCFLRPLVATSAHRARGAALTADGRLVLRLYRRVETRSRRAAQSDLARLRGLLGSHRVSAASSRRP